MLDGVQHALVCEGPGGQLVVLWGGEFVASAIEQSRRAATPTVEPFVTKIWQDSVRYRQHHVIGSWHDLL